MSIDAVIKKSQMIGIVPDHLKTKKMCKNAVKKLLFVVRYVPDRYKTKKMCDNVILENYGTVSLFLTATGIKKMYNKALNNYAQAL